MCCSLKTASLVKSIKVMSNSQVIASQPAPIDGRIIYDYQIGSLEGRVLTFIESLGFTESREKAVKDIIKGILRTELYVECKIVRGVFLNEAIQKNLKADKENVSGL